MRTEIKEVRHYLMPLERLQTVIRGESMTRQDQADEVNINHIYDKTQRGEIVLASGVMPTFGDFSQEITYDVALEKIMEAEEAFASLPAIERKKYGNDPRNYYESVMSDAEKKVKAQAKAEADKKASEKLEADKANARVLLKDEIQQDPKT